MTFNQEKAHEEVVHGLESLKEAVETLTIVAALDAGIPSSKLAKIMRTAQSRVSSISKHIKRHTESASE